MPCKKLNSFIWPINGILQSRADQRVMVMKGYSMFPKVPGLEPHRQMLFHVIPKKLCISDNNKQEPVSHISKRIARKVMSMNKYEYTDLFDP